MPTFCCIFQSHILLRSSYKILSFPFCVRPRDKHVQLVFCQTTQEKNIPPQILCHYFLSPLLLLLLWDMLNSSCSRRVALGSSGEELIAQTSIGVPEVVLTCGVQFLF